MKDGSAKIVIVEWVDSHSNEGVWIDAEMFELDSPMNCVSIGWLVADRKESIKLASGVAMMSAIDPDKATQFAGTITIPRCCIKDIRTLKPTGKKIPVKVFDDA